MSKAFSADRLDVKAFAQAGAQLSGHDTLLRYKRLAQMAHKLHPDLRVDWTAHGELRERAGLPPAVWLQLQATAELPLVCQRCLGNVDVPLQVQRWFRFVPDEASALEQDNDSEEDLLVLSREFDLHELIEDELLLDLPLVPRHEECPVELKMSVGEEELQESAAPAAANPFAALANFKLRAPGK
ncbi:YceD family protein [Comamonas sp. NLF-1-9]|uniref:YceD family protein n=1 Tax=Comamonas sp. NLF-1-9 TaxID=2853163 RepID=UPI001C45F171|nr:YceD family protein [Comamonas sp. NLF-1-9]QXL84526.1 DUF177 domain-containing protein [Comamonas sp. NLF-1-9]